MSLEIAVAPGPAATGAAQPAASWSAIIAGAVAMLAASIVLTLAAAGVGVSLTFGGLASRGWLAGFTPVLGAEAIIVQVLSAAMGGYLAGRLRHPWGVHADESHFRDTAHGLLAWALATVAGMILGVMILDPWARDLAIQTVAPAGPPSPAQAERAGNISAQASLFTAIGMLLAAFVAAVAARLGGLRSEEMHGRL